MTGVWRFAGSAAVALALIGLWQLGADAGLISPVFFPGPDRSFGTLWEQLHEAEFWHAFAETLRRMALGFVSASLIGIAAGALIGLSRNLRDYVEPTLELIRPLPASAVIPVFVLLIGLNERMIIAVIAFASLWPVLLGTVHGFKTIEPRLIEVSRLLHLSPLELIFKIALPNAMPDIFAGLRLAAAVSLVVAVTVEITANPIGLGYALIVAQESMKPDRMFVFLIWIGFLGWLVNATLLRAQQRWFGRMGNWAEQAR